MSRGADAAFEPNANLVMQGVPPIPKAIAAAADQYTQFRGHAFVDWHPIRAEMIVSHRLADASTPQLFRVSTALGALEPLTHGPEPVREALYEPNDGRYAVFARATGGNEVNRLFRLDLADLAETPITEVDVRCAMLGWLHRRSALLFTSVPVDRTAAGGTRASVDTTFWEIDPAMPASRRKVAELPGAGWEAAAVAPDDRRIALMRYKSATESEIWTLDLASGISARLFPPQDGTPPSSNQPVAYSADGRSLFLLSNRAGEFQELVRLDLASGGVQRITANIPWDVSDASASDDGRFIALEVNVDGRGELRIVDARTSRELPLPPLPSGSVKAIGMHRRLGVVAFAVDSPRGPSEVHSLDLGSGRSARWTQAFVPPGLDTSTYPDQRIVRWKSFDGRTISGLLTPPPSRFGDRRPVIVNIHGGPEGQAKAGFMGRYNYFVNELGIAVIEPNVRGSSGYGKTYLTLDDGFQREDAVKDIGALLDWIAAQPELDASRVLVTGGSYGGYMSLSTSFHYADRIAGSIDVVGISNFASFLKNTESYRRDLRRVEYGDERDPAMRAFLDRISPLQNADRIAKPMFVVQGRNDPRVPYTEAEQIVARLRDNGTPVWYLRAENEGHGFQRKENADYQFYATVLFVQRMLLK